MGVLVGTSLIVIIPEGVETLYSAGSAGHSHARRGLVTRDFNVPEMELSAGWIEARRPADLDALLTPGPVIPEGPIVGESPPKTPTRPGEIHILDSEPNDTSEEGNVQNSELHSDEGHHDEESPHAWIGVALIAGFVLMYLIDKVPQYTSQTSRKSQKPLHISLDNLGRGLHRSSSPTRDSEPGTFLVTEGSPTQGRSFATTTGLVIHAAADGIALGASSSTPDTSLSFIIFLAIMVHKAPAAFGLTSVLLKQGLPKRTARAHLLLFSLAAPIGALLTWAFARSLGGNTTTNGANTQWWTGMLLLFSGGTFLYVAMHTMEEISSPAADSHGHGQSQPNGYSESRDVQHPSSQASVKDLMAAVFGMILPLFLQIGHAH